MTKILVVDDDLDILTLVQLTLTMNGFKVDAISRWEGINDSLQKFKPDLVLLDISLAGADGRDICRQLKQVKETMHLPVILFSANADMGKNYEECQAQAFIPKPFELSYLLQTINNHLN